MIKRLKNKLGLSLIELLFSLAILGITIIAISPLLVNTVKINKMSEQQYHATLLAQSYMECIKASSDIAIGQTTYIVDDAEVIIDISEVNKYKGEMYRVVVEIVVADNVLEKLEGYKILTH